MSAIVTLLVSFGENLVLVCAALWLYRWIYPQQQDPSPLSALVLGGLVGSLGLLAPHMQSVVGSGGVPDAQLLLIVLIGARAGPPAAIGAAILDVPYRLWLGDPVRAGLDAGAIVSGGIVGILAWYWLRRCPVIKPAALILLGLASAVVSILWVVLPAQLPGTSLFGDAVLLLVAYPLGALVFGTVFAYDYHRSAAEVALQESEARYRTLASHFPNGAVLLFDHDLRYTLAEGAGLAASGLSKTLLEGKTIWEVFPTDICQAIELPFRAALAGTRMTTEVAFRDHIYRMHTLPVEDKHGRVITGMAMTQDITLDRQMQVALKASEERYARLADATFEGIGICKDDIILDANARLAEMVGYTRQELIGMPTAQLIAPQSREHVRMQVQAGQQGRYEHLALRKDGSVFPVEVRSRPLSEQGHDVRVTIAQDISERVAAQHALEQSELRFRTLFERAAIGIALVDRAGHPIVSNPALEALLGYSASELRHMTFAMLTHPDDVDTNLTLFEELLSGARKSYQFEKRYLRKDGQIIWGRLTVSLIFNGDQPEMGIGMIEDITERKRIEQQYLQAQKMEALGRLAGGVAHDFNNLLTVILGSSDLLLSELDLDHPLRQDVVPIQDAAAHAAGLTRQLLTFSHQQVRQLDTVNLNSVVSSIEALLRRSIGEDITLVTRLAEDLGSVQVDVSQLEQVLLNLAVNARDAMPGGGTLIIETANTMLDARSAPERDNVHSGPYVRLAISDTGYGMDAVTQTRMFEPFFTTKASGKGTGLGLSIVYGIVRQSGGHIWVYSEVGQGTTFKIYLPQATTSAAIRSSQEDLALTEQDSGTLLLVEDEPLVRALTARILRARGYGVLEAEDGATALHIAAGYPGGIDILLTDVIMPGGISGPQLAEQLVYQRPGLRVLYMSGYTDTAIAHHGTFDPRLNLLQKPFTAAELAQRIWNVLHSGEGWHKLSG